jgi:hypothetical protein
MKAAEVIVVLCLVVLGLGALKSMSDSQVAAFKAL